MAKLSRRKLAANITNRLIAGESKQKLLRELAAYLIDSGRTGEAELVIRDVESMLLTSGTAVGTVTTARPLSAGARSDIESFIRGSDQDVKNIVLREHIDETLIAGMKLELPGAQLDTSVKAKLDKITA